MKNSKKVVAGVVLAGAALLVNLKRVEKQELRVYADKLAYGIPTVCSGHTDRRLKVGDVMTQEACDAIDSANAEKYGMAVLGCTHIQLTQEQFDAITLFAINVGTAGACKSRALKLINEGRYEEGCRALANAPVGSPVTNECRQSEECMRIAQSDAGPPVWVYAGGKFVKGLYNRRNFEKEWCLKKPENISPAYMVSHY